MEMREIKFRAADKRFKKISKPFGIHQGIFWEDNHIALTDDLEVMQYTGLKDKNGTEIYEGDILRCGDINPDHQDFNTEVWFHEGKFLTRNYGFPVSSWAGRENSWCEVIGNIYENPELLKEKSGA